jgi:hypothetical protein
MWFRRRLTFWRPMCLLKKSTRTGGGRALGEMTRMQLDKSQFMR